VPRYRTGSSLSLTEFCLLQELFKPLLGALGLESVQMSAVMKELGGALSLRGGLSALRINIVDSDFGPSTGRRPEATKGKVRFLVMIDGHGAFEFVVVEFRVEFL